jgi:hypothetical protein
LIQGVTADELADVYVVLCCMVGALEECLDGEPLSISEKALAKAQADIERGVR